MEEMKWCQYILVIQDFSAPMKRYVAILEFAGN
jgi:hypothetical protein